MTNELWILQNILMIICWVVIWCHYRINREQQQLNFKILMELENTLHPTRSWSILGGPRGREEFVIHGGTDQEREVLENIMRRQTQRIQPVEEMIQHIRLLPVKKHDSQ